MLAMTQLGEAWLPLILVILGQQYLGIHVEVVQKIIWSFAISGLITQIIKHAMDRERPTKLEDAILIIETFINTEFSTEEKHHRRVEKIINYEENN